MGMEEFLKELGAGDHEILELTEYNKNRFSLGNINASDSTALKDEPFAEHWKNAVAAISQKGTIDVLRENFIQLSFPIASGMSENEEYLLATKRGIVDGYRRKKDWLDFKAPELLKLFLYPTFAGSIPVIYTGCRKDFILMVQALTRRNEPAVIPDSMGACMVKGYNNWKRISDFKSKFHSELLWNVEKESFFSQKPLYQDRFIIISDGEYSGINEKEMGLSPEEWREKSLAIRLAHEGVHYFTERFLGSSNANVFDEFIADYAGIKKAFGIYKAEWFLKFMGLEGYPLYRPGGRLENYKGRPPLSDSSFIIIQKILHKASMNLEAFEKDNPNLNIQDMLLILIRTTLIDIASGGLSKNLQV